MLEPVCKAADDSCLPMTVWPSNNIGVRFAGLDCLITFVSAELGEAPGGCLPGLDAVADRVAENMASAKVIRQMRRKRAAN
jgi:hypothetical protein